MKKKKNRNYSVQRILLTTSVVFALIIADVFTVSVQKMHLRSGTDLTAYADSANTVTETTKALRGNIYDRNGNVIAQDNRTYNIVCILDENRPAVGDSIVYVKDKEGTAEKLSEILGADYNTILNYLSQDVYQTELGNAGRNLSKTVKDEIEALELPGIEFTDSIQRVYPLGTFASNLVGYAQADETGSTIGRMGLELYLDSYLSGTDGSRTYQADKDGYILPGMRETVQSAVNGYNVTLTLDEGIQNALEQSMAMTEEQFNADRVWGAVMEIDTGKVIAWGQSPSFDPNVLDITEYSDYGTQNPYEPGSTMKAFTWASAINEGVYDGNQTVDGYQFCFTSDAQNNPVRTYSENNYGCIYNARKKDYGALTLDKGLVYSANTAAAAIQTEVITPATHLSYLKKFGFFQSVDTDGIPEETGLLNFTWPAEKLALSYGQGSTATMLQMIQAYSAVFSSEGKMVKPYFVESIKDPYDSSNVIYQAETTVVGEPITGDTAKQVQQILWHVVNDDDGTAKYYQIPECEIIGKTGTTEYAVGGTYESNKTISSFMCAMPADDPQVLVYYCFQADYDRNSHYYTEAQINLLRKVAITYGFTSRNSTGSETETTETTEISTYEMPSLLNHTIEYALNKLDGMDTMNYSFGSGTTIIDQFPKAGDTVKTGQRVFLVTDTTSFAMPDMIGWTRKDVAGLWSATGFGFEIEGEGTVVSQSIPAGTTVTKGTTISVVLE